MRPIDKLFKILYFYTMIEVSHKEFQTYDIQLKQLMWTSGSVILSNGKILLLATEIQNRRRLLPERVNDVAERFHAAH